MEEIKNWWGVFGLLGCVTVVSSSLERRCHRQGSLAGPPSVRRAPFSGTPSVPRSSTATAVERPCPLAILYLRLGST